MPGIQLPIGIETVNPVDADYKRGPWPTIAAALAGINIALRYNNLSFYVVGDPNEYYWLDTNLSDAGLLIRSSGGSSLPISITRANLLTAISGSTLIPYTTYLVTDAQDALGGTVSVSALSTNTINANGIWNFIGKLPAQGFFRLATGAAGSVNQISVIMPAGLTNLMTAAIPYTTSRNNTAALVVANINANSLVSGCRAFVIPSTVFGANFDVPIIAIEAVETITAFVHTMTVSLTTLTASNITNPIRGFTPNNLSLGSFYDPTADRILEVNDFATNVVLSNTAIRIGGLGFNPVTTFRWRDPRFQGINLVNTGIRDIIFTGTSIRSRISASESNISNFLVGIFRDVNLLNNSSLSNINCLNFSLSDYNSRLTIADIHISTGFGQIINNLGSILSISNSTFPSLNLVFNTGLINISTVTAAGGFTLTNNFISPSVSTPATLFFTATTFAGVVTFNKNEIYETTSLDNLAVGSVVVVENEMHGAFRISGTATSINIRRSVFNPCSLTLSFGAFVVSGTLPTMTILDSVVTMDFTGTTISPTSFDIYSTIVDRNTRWARMIGGSFLVQGSIIGVGTLVGSSGGTIGNVSIYLSTLYYTDLAGVTNLSMNESHLKNCILSNPNITLFKSSLEKLVYTGYLELTDTSLVNNIITIKKYHDFTVTPITPGSPAVITGAIQRFAKKAVVAIAWNPLTDVGPPSSVGVGINGGSTYFQTVSSTFITGTEEDTTLEAFPVLVDTDYITLNAIGSTINGGSISLTITGSLLTEN